MSDHDLSRHAGDPRVRALLQDLYAPPADPAYWAGLEARVLARVRQGGDAAPEWWQLVGRWSRGAALAAGVGALAAAAALFQLRAADARAVYEAVVETTPALPLTAVAHGADSPTDVREATLRYVISY